ncbi:MAG: SDR family oxidoreductase [Ruminococcaceae bacterium]|nr:SDR family oxidoreductase [Oscillospiraceae bacterium]
MFDLTGKTALITGASQGIGYAIARCLADSGAKVYIGGTDEAKAIAAAESIPGATAAVCDLGLTDCAERLYAVTGDVDILVLNASVQFRKAWDAITDEEFDRQIAVNLKASLKLIQKYAPHMKAQNWGRIVTIGSVQQVKPHKDMLIYAASKAAQLNMVTNLAKQLAPFGITVNNVAPGVIETPRNEEALADEAYRKQVLAGIPCGFAGAPEDCAGQVLLLCSDAGRYMTGENIFIDGGMKL